MGVEAPERERAAPGNGAAVLRAMPVQSLTGGGILEGTPGSGPESGANPLQVTEFVTAAVCYIYTAQQRRVLRLTGFTEIGRVLLVPVGGGTHQESRNNGDRLEPWKGIPAAGQNPVRSGLSLIFE
jgi:hypothetical protein